LSSKEEKKEMQKSERVEWDGKIAYRFFHHRDETPFISTSLCQISLEGLSFFTAEAFPTGSILILKLYGYKDYSPIKVLGKVLKSQHKQERECFETECHYHELSPAQRSGIHEILEEISFIHRIHQKVKLPLQKETALEKDTEKALPKHGSKRT